MPDSVCYLDSLPVRCRVYGLSAQQSDSNGHEEGDRVLMGDRPFHVQLTVEFVGNAAIALLMLDPILIVELFANPTGIGEKVELGTLRQDLMPEQLTYALMLDVDPPTRCGLEAGLYHLIAVIRIGAENGPAFLFGSTEGVAIQVFSESPPHGKQKSTKRKRQPSNA